LFVLPGAWYVTVSRMTVQNRFYARPEAAPTQLRLQPRLASWDATDHPDQVRLRAALEDVGELLAPVLAPLEVPLAMRLDVGLPRSVLLLGEHDLDNYAYPLMSHLAKRTTREFVSVWCTKPDVPHFSRTVWLPTCGGQRFADRGGSGGAV